MEGVHHVFTGIMMQCPLLHQCHCLFTILDVLYLMNYSQMSQLHRLNALCLSGDDLSIVLFSAKDTSAAATGMK